MTPKEKANELVEKFTNFPIQKLSDYSRVYHPTAKYFALICVDEMLNNAGFFKAHDRDGHREYWQQVKQEIEIL